MLHRKTLTLTLAAAMLFLFAAGAIAQDQPETAPFHPNYESALAAGQEKGQEILVEFYTDW